MSRNPRGLPWAMLLALLVAGGMTSCGHTGATTEEGRVKLAFDSCKSALVHQQSAQAMTYFPRNVNDYLKRLNSNPPASPAAAASASPDDSPVVTLFLRTALEKKVPPDLRATLTLDTLMQRVTDKRLLNLRTVQDLDLGRISVDGKVAYAQLYYQGTLTALRLPFIKEDGSWKIDLMAILPSAELLMRLDRAIKGETESQQVEQLVKQLPSL